MKNIFVSILALLFVQSKSFACLNAYFTYDREGNMIELDYDWKKPFDINFDNKKNESKLKKLEIKLEKDKNYMVLSDYSVVLMQSGRPKEALSILTELYQYYPEEYKISSNLGTAYELVGIPDSAIKYIKRGIELNPGDHAGSEWIHVRILEAKMALQKDPNYMRNLDVLMLSENEKSSITVMQQLVIQLRERVPFATPGTGDDSIMASLFIDLGDLAANTYSVVIAKAYYEIAKYYYGCNSAALSNKLIETKKWINKHSQSRPTSNDRGEGSIIVITPFDYRTLLNNRNEDRYAIHWELVNTDVASLIAMVDFSKSPAAIRDSIDASVNKITDGFSLILEAGGGRYNSENTTVAVETADNSKAVSNDDNWVYLTVVGIILAAIGLFVFLRRTF